MQLNTYKFKIILIIIFSLIISAEVYSGRFQLFKKLLKEAASEQFNKVKVHGGNIKLSESGADILAEKGTDLLKAKLKLDKDTGISKTKLNKKVTASERPDKIKLLEPATETLAEKRTETINTELKLDNKPNLSKKVIESNNKSLIKSSLVALTISPSVSNTNIKILNIKKKYKDGINLKPGSYEISVEKSGYFPQRFWKELKKTDKTKVVNNVEMYKIEKSITIIPSVVDATINILNFNKKYKDNIKLPPGSYQISVEKTGYRSQRFWIEINKISKSYMYYNVELHKRGIRPAYCAANLTEHSYGSAFSSEGQLIQLQLLIENASVPEIYLSLAEMQTDFTNFQIVLDSKLSDDYAYYKLIQASGVTAQQIKNNANIEIDPDRHIQHTWALEKKGSSVLFILQAKIPGGVFISSNFKGFICNEFKDL